MEKHRKPARGRFSIGVTVVVAALGAGAAIPALASSTSNSVPDRASNSTPDVEASESEPQTVWDRRTQSVVGHVRPQDDAAAAQAGEYPLLPDALGRRGFRGLEVFDDASMLVGYLVSGFGFVDLASSRDDDALDALLAERALSPDEQAELDALEQRMREEARQALAAAQAEAAGP